MKSPRRQELTSPHNPLLRALRRALREGELAEDASFGVEGPHLVEEALRSPVEVTVLIAARSAEARLMKIEALADGRLRSYVVPDRVFRSLSDTETPQGVAALVRLPARKLGDCLAEPRALVIVLVGVQDPGNLGTILRSLEAFGGSACLLTPGTVSPFNSKAVRASAGALFRVPVFRGLRLEEILGQCRQHGLQAIGLAPRAKRQLDQTDLRRPVALFIGQEGSGLPSETLKKLDGTAEIPLAAPVESLNAAMAATLALYEAARQRRS
ncbi:MAG TPA: RNA methyltransferase [Candidatus Acidoferrales bacterium]|nr:RNA methyltransferase [Candidatus Acidoferrales bacterium]